MVIDDLNMAQFPSNKALTELLLSIAMLMIVAPRIVAPMMELVRVTPGGLAQVVTSRSCRQHCLPLSDLTVKYLVCGLILAVGLFEVSFFSKWSFGDLAPSIL